MAFQEQKSAGTIRWERDWAIKCNNNMFFALAVNPRSAALPASRAILFGYVPRPEGLGCSVLRPSGDKIVQTARMGVSPVARWHRKDGRDAHPTFQPLKALNVRQPVSAAP
jgi:hypothetical protein